MRNCVTRLPTLNILRITSLLLFCLLFWSQALYSSCSASSQDTMIVLTQEQSTELLEMLKQQESALTEALSLVEQAQTELDESNQELIACQAELLKQKRELTALKKILTEQQNELSLASKSIASANTSLEQAKKDMIKLDEQHKAKERKLTAQKTFWQIISIVLGGVAIAK